MLIILQCLSLGFVAYPWWAKLPIGSVGYQEASDHSLIEDWTKGGGYVGKLHVSPFLPFLPACLPEVEDIDFWKMAKRKKNVIPKTSICGKAFFPVCVCTCVHVLESIYTNTCFRKRGLWAFMWGTIVWRSEENLYSWFCPAVWEWAALWSAGFVHTSAFAHCPLLLYCCDRTLGGRKCRYSLSLREGTWREEQNEAGHGLLSLLSYTAQDSLSRVALPLVGWALLD